MEIHRTPCTPKPSQVVQPRQRAGGYSVKLRAAPNLLCRSPAAQISVASLNGSDGYSAPDGAPSDTLDVYNMRSQRVSKGALEGAGELGSVLVWFKSDLRLDDHPGLKAAQRAKKVLPVFCFDPTLHRELLRLHNGVQGLVTAAKSLQTGLRALGSDLLVLEGRASELLPDIVSKHKVDSIIAEEEVDYRWVKAMLEVSNKLPAVELLLYKASLYRSDPYSDSFRHHMAGRGDHVIPLDAPDQLPGLPSGAEQTPRHRPELQQERWWSSLKAADKSALSSEVREAAVHIEGGWSKADPRLLEALSRDGETSALATLREYLGSSFSSSTTRQILGDAIAQSESRATPLGSFPAIFCQANALGTISQRRVSWEAKKILETQQTLVQRITRTGHEAARSAVAAAEAADYHWHLAREDRKRDTGTGVYPRHWRWRGFLTDYFTADPEERGGHKPAPDAPAFLLVHGFGAFGEQWRGQLQGLAAANHYVFAPTLPGYGRAEKPSLPYSQYLWVDFLRDFVIEVVRRPVIVVGNSIGGFISASLAADYRNLVKGLVLLNSAGLVQKGYKPSEGSGELQSPATLTSGSLVPAPVFGPPGIVADAMSSALLFYLEQTVARTLTRVYPVNPERADAWLKGEIKRAASDPGAQKVFRSVFYLPKPRALNYLVHEAFGGPTLILQGKKDPLQNAKGRAKSMQRLCPNVKVVLMDAGHCPFDEQPDICNQELLAFAESLSKLPVPPANLAPAAV